jgi:hypothetical protein
MQKNFKMKKSIKIVISTVLIAFLLYNSIYIEKLSARKADTSESKDFSEKAAEIYQKLIGSEAPALEQISTAFKTNKEAAFEQYSNRLGIGNTAYVLCQTSAKVLAISDKELTLQNTNGESFNLSLAFIFGNAIRDASKQVKLTDYKKTSDFNQLSETLNALIREQNLPKDIGNIKVGDNVKILGAFKQSKLKEVESTPQIMAIKISKL